MSYEPGETFRTIERLTTENAELHEAASYARDILRAYLRGNSAASIERAFDLLDKAVMD